MKYLLIVLFIAIGCSGYGQQPFKQKASSIKTVSPRPEIIEYNFTTYCDTTEANLHQIKKYAGAIIIINCLLYFRDKDASKWIMLTPSK